ncbi:MAG: leucyl/phenylalanyl-tRNA--protein transferase [Gammaproteobacteria bacterium]|nr:leucyl/phenylalanyl-tRNA--protein transferase [Gammaproteobacteria bacterium]
MTHQDKLPFLLDDEIIFPDTEFALEEPNGLLAVGGNLSKERLMLAYQNGIFPWYSDRDPILWWSPNPRAVLYLNELKVSRSLAKSIRNRNFEVFLNKDFEEVMYQCAKSREHQEGTWITNEMQVAYLELHHFGSAHSISVYLDGELVGGLYGISQGKFFFGESMFSKVSDASKVALYQLVQFLKKYEFLMIDCQVPNAHLTSLGSRNILRSEFTEQLQKCVDYPQSKDMWQQQNL